MSEAARDDLLTPEDVAERLGISVPDADALIRRTPGHVRLGRRTYRLPAWCLDPTDEQRRVLEQLAEDGRAALAGTLRRRALARPVMRPMHVTYVVHAPAAELVKIGQSTDFGRRHEQLVAGSPVPLALVAQFAGRDMEEALHVAFSEHRKHGEWFAARPVLDYLREIGAMLDG